MNKYLSVLLVAVVLLCALFVTACNEEKHEHEYSETVIKEPTCTEGGQIEYVCECGDSYVKDTEAAGHSYDEGTVTDPTCVKDGYTEYVCSVCSYVYQDTFVPATEKNHNYVLVDSKQPSCTEWGYEKKACEYCHDEIVTELSPVHDMIDGWFMFKEPTCTENGEERKFCGKCSYFESREVPAQHKYEERFDIVVDPTCEEEGYVLHTCSGCGYQYKSNIVPATGHTWIMLDEDEWTTSKEANCTEYGEEYRKCDTCGYVEKRYIDYKHEYEAEIVAPGCSIPGYTTFTCKICGHTEMGDYTEPKHNFGDWTVEINSTCSSYGMEKRTCVLCSYTEKQVIAPKHNYNDVTVVDPTKYTSGYTVHTCDCGDSYKDEFVSAFGSEGLTYQLRTIWNEELKQNEYVYVLTGIGTCTDTVIGIPSEYNGYPVAVIGNLAFYGCDDVTVIYLPNTVTKFEIASFWYCENLKEIHFEGTKEQWMAIDKPEDWNKHLDTFYVICQDGTLAVNAEN